MKSFSLVIGMLVMLSTKDCGAALISSYVDNIRFVDARQGIETGPVTEPLRFSVDTGDRVEVLHLGEYSNADVGKSFTFSRQAENDAEWEAVAAALRGDSVTGIGETTMWLRFTARPISYLDLVRGSPDYDLRRIDITPRYLRKGIDGNDTFRTAEFTAVFYWEVIPEPATSTSLMLGIAAMLAMRRRA
jgi:hypothetical protein